MDIEQKNKILAIISDYTDDIISAIEGNRFYPSIPEAGDSPTDTACMDAQDLVIELIEKLNGYTISSCDLTTPTSLDSVIEQILASDESSFADNFPELDEIDSFKRDHGFDKYTFRYTIYQYRTSGDHLQVVEQHSSGAYGDFISVESVNLVKKKEITTYEWS